MIWHQAKRWHIERTLGFSLAEGLLQNRPGSVLGQERTTLIGHDCEEIPRRIDLCSAIVRHKENYMQLPKEHKTINIPRGRSPPYEKLAILRVGMAHPTENRQSSAWAWPTYENRQLSAWARPTLRNYLPMSCRFHPAYLTGSVKPASAKPLRRNWHESQWPQGRPCSSGS